MKVIFIEDVPNVARAGQTRVVANGYARNYLLPRKLAVLANSQAAATVEVHLKKVAKQRAIEEAEMAELAKEIDGVEITVMAKVGEKERLYGSVTAASIAEELSKTIGREVDKRKVELAEPLRQVGVYDVTIRFTHEIMASINVTVMSDEPGAVRPEKTEKKTEEAEEEPEEKMEKKEKPVKKSKEEKPEKAEKEDKPPKEKKIKPEKAEATIETEQAEKKEKKTRAKAEKKTEKAETEPEEAALESEEEAKES